MIVVAGGGLAGAAAAAGLARAGHAVTLIERETTPSHKICGEFLSTEAQDDLAKLGVDLHGLGGVEITRLALVRGGQAVMTDLPFRGIGLSRRRLDEAVLRHAEACGVKLLRGRMVRSISTEEKLSLDVQGLGVIAPDQLLLATGKHDLRGIKRDFAPKHDLIGFKTYFRLTPQVQAALAGLIQLVFFDGGYAGLQMIEDGLANLCLLVTRKTFQENGGSWPALLQYLNKASPYLARQLAGAQPALPQPLSIYRVPYGFVYRPAPNDPPGLFRLGDQACVIQSFTGDGMSIALHSARLAAQTLSAGQDGPTYHRRLACDVGAQIRRADVLYTLMNNAILQSGLFAMTKLWPASLQIAAKMTRVPVKARQG